MMRLVKSLYFFAESYTDKTIFSCLKYVSYKRSNMTAGRDRIQRSFRRAVNAYHKNRMHAFYNIGQPEAFIE